ncbi:toll/interleukin-1 receptor domain-containing protein [Streptomyces sp. NBC_00647]|uniref:toll/interleukin-1 receptor domain-containing protein n=1 Tax=Streptomyces sp. NBC_00647 TaxID=2975796 RepID=UPI0032506214
MDSILKVAAYGEDLPGDVIGTHQVVHLLERLGGVLERRMLTWRDVSLLLVANSKNAATINVQQDTDQNIREGLEEFCSSEDWWPSLIGASVFSSFFRSADQSNLDISDGLLVVAFSSSVFDKIPVACEVTKKQGDRRYAGKRVLHSAIQAYCEKISDFGLNMSQDDVAESSTGIIFTSGSGHTEARQVVDFKDCFAVGQELLAAADELNAELVGGCATNRSKNQLQSLYYSDEINHRVRYKYTYQHAAVLALLPHIRARLHLNHPYKHVADQGKLKIVFHPQDQYAEGRYFYIQEINDQPPIDFLANYWGFTKDELNRMVTERVAIPVEPKAHLVTIASSLNRWDVNVWPNVPIWLDEINDKVMLRLVRAEAEDGNFYLMEMDPLDLNAKILMGTVHANYNRNASIIAFLCESRKIVLNHNGSNVEAEDVVSGSPAEGAAVGVYLNGEYSTGSRVSIGYHNYSQIGAIFPDRPIDSLPPQIIAAKRTAKVRLFACHASRDKPTVRAFIGYLQGHIQGSTMWIDEREIKAGDILQDEIRAAMAEEDQLVIPFLSDRSVEADWVKRELSWAFEEEKRQGRTIVLPVVLDDRGDAVMDEIKSNWNKRLSRPIRERLYIKVNDFTEEELRSKARRLAGHIAKRLADES